jgi:hypothetical protein
MEYANLCVWCLSCPITLGIEVSDSAYDYCFKNDPELVYCRSSLPNKGDGVLAMARFSIPVLQGYMMQCACSPIH